MKRVTALGGVFIKCDDPAAQRAWYNRHLGLQTDEYGASFEWRKADAPEEKGHTVWSTFKRDTDYFAPSEKEFMLNFRVEDLENLLVALREEGVTIVGEMQVYEYGKFAHIIDPEGTKIELWESNDEKFEEILSPETITK
jgi:predicted enzyme related to lactoylglutathione lyase